MRGIEFLMFTPARKDYSSYVIIRQEALERIMEAIGDRLKSFIQRLSAEAKRTSGIVQAKMELNKLQGELDRKERAVGRKVSLLKKRGALKDKFMLEALKEELEMLNECEKRVEIALKEIQELTAINLAGGRILDTLPGLDELESESELDSFKVS
jgi:hypothetical protein